MSTPEIITNHRPKPGPLRLFDWEARRDVSDETGLVVGYGRSAEEAVNDLMLQLKEVRR